ncbi:trypsin-like cysteine/serine peptidase domain-containing protein [Favolaschia claudopus]|uniref:Trypsin-like cysteine/serine peptidase domain-containing protein n=1 Tax=Favolaschia claudopus TaxID=2862362 RepID=A0AAW0AQ79_9AGAR
MPQSTRRLRSAGKLEVNAGETSTPSSNDSLATTPGPLDGPSVLAVAQPATTVLQVVKPGAQLPGLEAPDLALLRKKQRRLKAQAADRVSSLPNTSPEMRNALEASLIFAQHEAGSAVCIDAAGWVLTCAHCIGETEEEYRASPTRWLLFYTGLAVRIECRVWDAIRDLALLKIIAVESVGTVLRFPFLRASTRSPVLRAPIVCIGQPGQDDLESTSARRTNYPFLEISEGMFRGMIPGADPHNNSEIGTLKHDAWTYWGHSGAPLILAADGTLIGLHSSWDDKTAMRHGVPHEAIVAFLKMNLNV